MATTSPQSDPSFSEPQLAKRYEAHDLKTSWLVRFTILFIVFALILHVSLWYMMLAWDRARGVDPPRSAISVAPRATDAPALQPSPAHDRLPSQDLQSMLAGEDEVFRQLGWEVDPQTHRVRIPDAVIARVAGEKR